ncbi:MAG: AMP-binding protein [Clostridia bacterium]|nr:AMP-binding protein [Clostridia bacterium]
MERQISTVRGLSDYAAETYRNKDYCRFFRGEEMCAKTFGEFHEDCLAMCRYIRHFDSKKMNIGFIGKTSYEYIACLTGMIFSGNIVVPFAPEISVEEACDLFAKADIEMLFCEEEFKEKAEKISKKYSGLKQIVSLGDWHWFEDVFKKYSSDSSFASLSDVECKKDDCALIIYTSGTTGDRKGVMLSNGNLTANSCYEGHVSYAEDISFSVLPMHHVFCYSSDVLRSLYDGTTICLNGDMINLYKNFLAFQPTVMRVVPLLCKSILTRIKITHKKNPELTKREAADRVVGKNFTKMLAGSAFLSPALTDELAEYGIIARQGYGMSECSPRITVVDFSEECKYSNGIVLGVDEVRVVDGEIQVKGPSVMMGYYKNPEKTKEAFTEDGFLHTGDLGFIEKGHVFLVGRKKNLIILSNGENISPEEIENCFADDGVVKEVIVYAEQDKIMAEIFPDEALAQASGITDIYGEIESIVDRANVHLPSDRQIHSFKLREKPFPRTTTGKIKRTEFHY